MGTKKIKAKVNCLITKTVGKGKNIVLLPGFGFDTRIFQTMIDNLKSDFKITAIDLPGFGENETFQVDADNPIKSISEAIFKSVPEHAIWIGWSLGGFIALWVSIFYPKKIKAFIAISSTPRFIQTKDWFGVSRLFFNQFKHGLEKNYMKTMSDFLVLQSMPNKDRQFIHFLKKFVNNQPISFITIKRVLTILEKGDLRQDLHKIQCPSLFVIGEKDPLVSSKNKKIKTVQIADAGHMPFLTHPDLFIKIIKEFLENNG